MASSETNPFEVDAPVTRGPQTIEEYIVAALEESEGCAPKGGAVIPPPELCPGGVHTMYAVAQSHVVTILVVMVFVIVLIQMIMVAINPGGGH